MTLADLLSTQSRNALRRHFPKQPDILSHPQEIADSGPQTVSCARGIGEASMREIAFALYELGTIERNDLWLKPYLDELKSKSKPDHQFLATLTKRPTLRVVGGSWSLARPILAASVNSPDPTGQAA